MGKPLELFGAYEHGKLPPSGGGYILSVFYDSQENTLYTKYEIIAYNNLKDITYTVEGLWFKSDGYKVHVLLEPGHYPQRFQEPILRDKEKAIPYRFDDLEIFSIGSKNHRVMVSKNPQFNFSSFTIQKPVNDDFSVYFPESDTVFDDINEFLNKIIQNDIGASSSISQKIAKYITGIVKGIIFKAYE